jgi:glycosyltransferase involved in cell wall biosynthesis
MVAFSIIVPVYNVKNYLAQCLNSIINQTFKDFEVLCVEDCSTDGSDILLRELAQTDKRIKILYHEKNKGLAAARNTAIDAAKGKYIFCLDSDDWAELNALEIIYKEFQRRKTNSIWFNCRKYWDNDNRFDVRPTYNYPIGYMTIHPDNIAYYADFTWIKAYTRESIVKHNLHWPDGLTFEDGEFYFKYFTLNPKTYFISNPLINYRLRDGSIVREADKGNVKMEDIYQVVEHLKSFYIEKNLYDKYKITLLKLIQNRVRMCRGLKYSPEYKKLSYEFIKKMNYPEEYSQFDLSNGEKTELVSIIIPIDNSEKLIKSCINSLQTQYYDNIEVLCVDNNSKDKSVDIIKSISKNDDRIKLISSDKTCGLGWCKNTGLKNSNGRYVFFVKPEDRLKEELILDVVNKFKETHYNTIWFNSEINHNQHGISQKFNNINNSGDFVVDNTNISKLPENIWTKAYDRDFLISNNIKWDNKNIFGDLEVYFQIYTKDKDTYIINEPLYIHNYNNKSEFAELFQEQKHIEDLYIALKNIRNYLIQTDLMEEYQNSFLELVNYYLNLYKQFPDIQIKALPFIKRFLEEIKFPNKYKER